MTLNFVAVHLSHTVLLHLKQSLPVLFLVQFTAIRHCFSVSAFICETILKCGNPIGLLKLGRCTMLSLQKNMIHLFTLFTFSYF